MTRGRLEEILTEFGVGAFSAEFQNGVADSIRLIPSETHDSLVPLGASRLGGRPDLPGDEVWPRCESRPLSFVAQIALADLADSAAARQLHIANGSLCFFCRSEVERLGSDAKLNDFAVLYFPDTPLERRDFPSDLPVGSRYGASRLSFADDISFPSRSEPFGRLIAALPKALLSEISDFIDAELERGSRSILFGHPDDLQGPMEMTVAMQAVRRGLVDRSALSTRADLRAEADRWSLLLQLASEPATGMMWGDLGCLYFWCRTKAGALGPTWLTIQSG